MALLEWSRYWDDHVTGMVVTKWIVTLLECSYYLNDCYCSRMVAQQRVISNNCFVTVTSLSCRWKVLRLNAIEKLSMK